MSILSDKWRVITANRRDGLSKGQKTILDLLADFADRGQEWIGGIDLGDRGLPHLGQSLKYLIDNGFIEATDPFFNTLGNGYVRLTEKGREAQLQFGDYPTMSFASAKKEEEYIGVDLDGTLAKYDHWKGIEHIGDPIPKMVNRVKKWLEDGKKVKIFTARANNGKDSEKAIKAIKKWCKEHIGEELEVTAEKHHLMTEFWDDRAVRVEKNKGTRAASNSN